MKLINIIAVLDGSNVQLTSLQLGQGQSASTILDFCWEKQSLVFSVFFFLVFRSFLSAVVLIFYHNHIHIYIKLVIKMKVMLIKETESL